MVMSPWLELGTLSKTSNDRISYTSQNLITTFRRLYPLDVCVDRQVVLEDFDNPRTPNHRGPRTRFVV